VAELILRPYRAPGDTAALLAIRAAARPVEGDVKLPKPDDPWALVAEQDGAVVGFSRVDWWEEADGTRLYLLSGCVAPGRRGQGIGRRLLARQEDQAAAHWRARPGPGRPVLGGNADDRRPDVLALLRRAGYRVRFTLVDLARDPSGTPAVALPAGLILRPVQDDHHPLIYQAVETCFADHGLGRHPRSYADYRGDIRDVDLWLVAWDDAGVAGVVVNERERDGSVDTPWVAVLPRWRRRGVAQAMLYRSLALLAARGCTTATIRTTQENKDHTVELYEKVGYRVTARHPRWGKPLGGQEPPGQR
jgi:ribosomal protein S18 acetylase RimI-like enzyme